MISHSPVAETFDVGLNGEMPVVPADAQNRFHGEIKRLDFSTAAAAADISKEAPFL